MVCTTLWDCVQFDKLIVTVTVVYLDQGITPNDKHTTGIVCALLDSDNYVWQIFLCIVHAFLHDRGLAY